MDPLADHESAIFLQCLEVVALVDEDEGLQCFEVFPGLEYLGVLNFTATVARLLSGLATGSETSLGTRSTCPTRFPHPGARHQ